MYQRKLDILSKIDLDSLFVIDLEAGIITSKKFKKRIGITENKCGYFRICIRFNGKREEYFVHEIIAFKAGFSLLFPLTVNHIDGNKKNNSINNLESISLRENIIHAHQTGLVKFVNLSCGEKDGNAKLTLNQVREIRQKYFDEKVRISDLARWHNVSHTCIGDIVRYKTWNFGNAQFQKNYEWNEVVIV